MEIHKPKPWHGFREFLKEYLIIVIGVLTALAAEEVAQELHWHHEVERARHELDAEIKDSLGSAAERQALSGCLRERITVIRDALLKEEPSWMPPAGRVPPSPVQQSVRAIYVSPHRPWLRNSWKTALASGVLNHMPNEEVHSLARLYHAIDLLSDFEAQEGAAAVQLSPLSYSGKLTRAERRQDLATLATLDRSLGAMDLLSKQLREGAAAARIPEDKGEQASLATEQRQRFGSCVSTPSSH